MIEIGEDSDASEEQSLTQEEPPRVRQEQSGELANKLSGALQRSYDEGQRLRLVHHQIRQIRQIQRLANDVNALIHRKHTHALSNTQNVQQQITSFRNDLNNTIQSCHAGVRPQRRKDTDLEDELLSATNAMDREMSELKKLIKDGWKDNANKANGTTDGATKNERIHLSEGGVLGAMLLFGLIWLAWALGRESGVQSVDRLG